jgi:hypothetical protein
VDLEVVFSGRGFLDGRGLSSSLLGASSLADAVDRAPETDGSRQDRRRCVVRVQRSAAQLVAERRRQKREWQRAHRRAAAIAAQLQRRQCKCGCGAVLPERDGKGRPYDYIAADHRPDAQRAYRQRRRAQRATEQAA